MKMNNTSHMGICIMRDGENISAWQNLDTYYQEYKDGKK